MDDDRTDPPELIIRFVDDLPAQARTALFQLLAFLFDFLRRGDEEDFTMPTPETGEATLRRILNRDHLALLGGTVSVVGLIDFVFAKITHTEPTPEFDEAVAAHHGDMSLARHFVLDAAKKWSELRQGPLSLEALEEFSTRLTTVREYDPIEVTGRTVNAMKALLELPIPQELVEELEEDFRQGPIVDDQGRRLLTEEEVDRINKMVIVIQANEHPPPHFHVRYEKENASFAISDGIRLPGVKGLERFERNIRKWWKKNLCVLVKVWNDTRPTDCVVGPMEVPEECKESPTKA